MEAALCLWEAMLDVNMQGWSRDPENENRDETAAPLTGNHAGLYRAWLDYGTVEMRHAAIGLADFMLRVWDSMSETERETLVPYDWEFVPAFLRQIEWIDFHPMHLSDAREMAELILNARKESAE